MTAEQSRAARLAHLRASYVQRRTPAQPNELIAWLTAPASPEAYALAAGLLGLVFWISF
jgi:hypothetical protein